MQENYDWNLQDIFKNEEEFKNAGIEIKNLMEKINVIQYMNKH